MKNISLTDPLDPADFCVLDIETAGGNWVSFPEGFELLLIGMSYQDEFRAYTAERESLQSLADFLETFTGVLVTFNGAGFDLPILRRYFAWVLDRELRVVHHFDLLAEIKLKSGRRISLDKVSYYSFGERKMPWDHKLNRTIWEQEPQRLVEYNRVDLELTAALYRRVLANQPLYLDDTTVVLSLPGLDT